MARRLGELAAAGFAASTLGTPLLPHQWHMLEAAAERGDGPAYAHTGVLLLAPRQCGKTTAMFAAMLGRMLARPAYRAAYTAQSGIVVTRVFSNPASGWITQLQATPLAEAFGSSRSQGRESIAGLPLAGGAPPTGSALLAFPPVPGKLRSIALDGAIFDESQEHGHDIGNALLGDAGPTFTTRPRRQLWLTGTAGESGSWWRTQYDRAAAGDYHLIEIGTWPDGADVEDPATWRAHHPGLIAGMTDEAHLGTELGRLGPERFAREYGNRWGAPAALDQPIPDDVWRLSLAPDLDTPAAPAAVAFDTAADRSASTIAAAGTAGDGRTLVAVADHRPGSDWVAEAVAAIHARHPNVPVLADPYSPAGGAVETLTRGGVPVEAHTGAARQAAGGHFASLLEAGRVAVLPHPALDRARASAVRRFTDAGSWVWSRRGAGADISAMTSATMAVWAASRPAAPRPRAYTASRR